MQKKTYWRKAMHILATELMHLNRIHRLKRIPLNKYFGKNNTFHIVIRYGLSNLLNNTFIFNGILIL